MGKKHAFKLPIISIFLSGLIGGIFLTVLLKAIQFNTQLKVYTLLLNVDYIPFFKRYDFTEFVEVLFHLFISIFLGFFLYIGMVKINIHSKLKSIYFCTIACLIIGVLIYPTTMFSDRTPPVSSIPSILYWVSSHAFYGLLMGLLLPLKLHR